MEKKIKENLYDLYSAISQYKLLHEYWVQHKNLRSEEEIRERIKYIGKHKVKQKSEIETLMWVLGETIIDEFEVNDAND